MGTLYEKVNELREQIGDIQVVLEKFPNAKVYTNRCEDSFYYSKSVNPIADHFIIKENCECCMITGLIFSAWTVIEWRNRKIEVYANFPEENVGSVDWNKLKTIELSAIEEIKEKGYSDAAIEYLEKYKKIFDQERENFYNDDDEDLEDEESDEYIPEINMIPYTKDFDDGSEAAKQGEL